MLTIVYEDEGLGGRIAPVMAALGQRYEYEGMRGRLVVRRARGMEELAAPIMKITMEGEGDFRLVVGPLFPLGDAEEAQVIIHHELIHHKLGHLGTHGFVFWPQRVQEEAEVERALFGVYGQRSRDVYRKYNAAREQFLYADCSE